MKKRISLLEAFISTKSVKKIERPKIIKLQQERLKNLIAYARENSAFYKERYADIPENPNLEMLPPCM